METTLFNSNMLSPGVRAMRSLRMDAAHGTPTVKEQIEAVLGIGNMTPAIRASILAGLKADVHPVVQAILDVVDPILHIDEQALAADLSAFAIKELTALSSVASVEAAGEVVMAGLKAEGGDLLTFAENMAKALYQAIIALALAKLNKPTAGA
jgi:hypothetical protein